MAAAVAANKTVGGKWIPPLPKGWEARYDEENKTYFFIDHIHKKTQWDDPRFQGAPKQTQPTAQATSAAAASSLSRGRGGPIKPYSTIALQDLRPGQPREDRRKNSRSTVGEASLTNEVDASLVNKLKAEFPNATKELITDMLILCHNNERQTREQLRDLGFFVNNSTSGSSNHASPQKKTSTGAASNTKSPDRHPLSPAVATATSPTKKEISEVDKRKLLVQTKELFPKLDQNVIRIALNECHYNLEEVKALLAAWEKNYGNTDQSRGSGSTSVNSSATSVRPFSPTAASLEPRGLDEDVENKANNQRSSQPSTQSPSRALSPKRSSGVASVTQMLTKGDTVASKSSCSQHARAKQVTKPKQSASAAAVSQPTAITSQPAVEHKKSLYRTEAKGPDASLRKGPDSTLLTSDYTQASGPDKSLYEGPDHSRRIGPQGAAGPDVSLRCGPQSAILQKNIGITLTSGSSYL
ncbi:hypothetical protein BsWGS_23343 [Bradybaena similaris]